MSDQPAGGSPPAGSPPAGSPPAGSPPAEPAAPTQPTSGQLIARWRRLDRSDRFALAGATAMLVGALAVVVSDGVGANRDGGIAWVVALGAVTMLAIEGAGIVRPRFQEVRAVLLPGLALGLELITLFDLIQPVRYSADLEVFGGGLGLAGRLLAAIGAVAALVAAPPRRLRSSSLAGRLAVGALACISVGWLMMLVIPDGFAMRSIDALALLATAIAATAPDPLPIVGGTSMSIVTSWPSLVRPIAAALGALIVCEGVLSVIGELGPLAGSGATGVVGLVVYLVGGALLAVATFLDARPFVTHLRPSTPSAPNSGAA